MNEATAPSPTRAPAAEQRSALRAALIAHGLHRFAVFGTSVEGRIYPNGIEERSGSVLNEDGRIWFFWTGWDEERQAVFIDEWIEEEPTPRLTSGREYEQARRQLGLEA